MLFCYSCGNDDDETKDFLIGTWKHQFSTGYVYYTFNENGTGRYLEIDENEKHDDAFTYIHYPKECRIKLIEEGEVEYIYYEKVSDTQLLVYDFSDDVDVWIKQ